MTLQVKDGTTVKVFPLFFRLFVPNRTAEEEFKIKCCTVNLYFAASPLLTTNSKNGRSSFCSQNEMEEEFREVAPSLEV
jgi:hypothetical protein